MASEGYEHTFHWYSSVPESVVVTGTFDNWQSTLALDRLPSGKFSGKTKLPYDSKVLFKYIVDGQWQANTEEPTEIDDQGNVNNVLIVPGKPATTEAPQAAENGLAETPTKAAEADAAVAGGAAAGAVGAGAGFAALSSGSAQVPNEAHVPGEAPADPAPTPAVTTAAEQAIPTIPSGEHLSDALKAEPAAEPSDPVVPLVPATDAATVNPASFAEADGSDYQRLVPDPPTSAGVPIAASVVADQAAPLATQPTPVVSERSTDAPQLPPLSPTETGLGVLTATTGSENGKASGAVETQSQPETVAAEKPSQALPSPVLYPPEFSTTTKESEVPIVAAADTTSRVVPPSLAKDETSTTSAASAAPADAAASSAATPSSDFAALTPSTAPINGTSTSSPALPVKESPKVPQKDTLPNTTPPASESGKKGGYASLGKASAKDGQDPFTTPVKATAAGVSSTASTPAQTYTAPSTPSTPPHFKGDRARRVSFFQKVKNAFSPNKKSAA